MDRLLGARPNGDEIYIEVKTTCGNENTPFLISNNEVMFYTINSLNSFIYRLYNYDIENNYAEFYIIEKPSLQLHLKPVTYKAYISE